MSALQALISSGHVADLILLLMVVETALLTWRWQGLDDAPPPSRWLSQLAAGAALVLALRLSLTGASNALIGMTLLLAGVCHLAGYRSRWGE